MRWLTRLFPKKPKTPWVRKTKIYDRDGKLVATMPGIGFYASTNGPYTRMVYWTDGRVEKDVCSP